MEIYLLTLIPGGVTHIESGATYNNNVITVSTVGSVRGGDSILFAVPTPFGTSASQAVQLAIDGQSDSTFPLHDRNGDALHEDDLTVNSVYIAISDADSWDILILPAGSNGTTVEANPSGADGEVLRRLAVDGTNFNLASGISWGFQIDTLIVPELNQDAITNARIVLEDSGLTHYLTFLDWTSPNLNMITHLPVGSHIGLRQGSNIRILEVLAEWDSTNERYQVSNITTGILSESSSGTATELLLTAGVGSGTIYTTGTSFPDDPVEGQIFEFNDAATIVAKDFDTTTDLTDAKRGDVFKYNGTDWIKQTESGDEARGEILLSGQSFVWTTNSPAGGDAATTSIRLDRALTADDDGKLFCPSIRFDDADAAADSRFPLPGIDAKFVRNITKASAQTTWPGGGNPVLNGTPVQFLGLRFETTNGFGSAIWNLYYSGNLIGLLSSSIAIGATTLTVTATDGLSDADYIFIDDERIEIVTVDSSTQLTVVAVAAAHSANSRIFLDDGRGFFFTQTHAQQDGVADLEILLSGGSGEETFEDPRFIEVASEEVTTDGTTNWLWADTGIAKAGDNGWDQAASLFAIELEQHSGVDAELGRSLVSTGLIRKSEFNTLASPDENNNMLPASANSDDDAERYNVHMRETQSGGGLDMVIGRRSNGNIIIAGESGGHTYTVRVLSLKGGGAEATEEGQQSPEGVASLTAGYVHTLFYRYAATEPAAHTANWRFDDEWSNVSGPPSDSWYYSAAEALTRAELNPNFVEADNTLWECRGRFRRRLNTDGDDYIYVNSKEVFAVFGEQFSDDAVDWHGTQVDADVWQRTRTALGDWGVPTYIGDPGDANSGGVWEILRTFINVYRTGDSDSVANVAMNADLTEYSELRFRMYGLASSVTRRAPIIENVIQRPADGWPVDNDDASTINNFSTFQWRYGAEGPVFNVGLIGDMQPALQGHVTQEVVNPSDINIVYVVTIQASGRFKFYSPTNEESNVDSIIVFDQPGSYQRVRMEVSGR